MRLLYHTEEEVDAMEARELDAEKERNKPKEKKVAEEFKMLSYADIRAMDCKQRMAYA